MTTDTWRSGGTVPGAEDVLAVGHTLDMICDCPAAHPGHEATDPADRTRVLPHHFDCAAVYAWPAVERVVAERVTQALTDTARAWQFNGWAQALLPWPQGNPALGAAQRVTDWLRARANDAAAP